MSVNTALAPQAINGLASRPSRSLFSDAWRRLLSSWNGRVGLTITGLIILIGLLAPIVSPYDPTIDSNLVDSRAAPSLEHPFGADRLGRDIFRRIIHGTRISLTIGFVVVFITGGIGTILGLMAGYFGGWIDSIIMRLMDILLAFPSILLAIAIVAVRGASLGNTIIAVAVVGVAGYARVVRSVVLSVRERDYVEAARMIGVKNNRIMFRHILPNSLSPIIVQVTIGVGGAILTAAALGFLGLGAQPPAPEWGAMIADGTPFLRQSPHMVLFPGLAIMFTVLGFNLLGDGLRDALDPQLRD
ncbi:MAG: ABC transporter permease [Caldilineaceae bacterium]|nr:ABC transporter permease [Caldilineaceae bacterium]HRJ42221.1 ABC transporter permease [Caldilineaceae bacterium]